MSRTGGNLYNRLSFHWCADGFNGNGSGSVIGSATRTIT